MHSCKNESPFATDTLFYRYKMVAHDLMLSKIISLLLSYLLKILAFNDGKDIFAFKMLNVTPSEIYKIFD